MVGDTKWKRTNRSRTVYDRTSLPYKHVRKALRFYHTKKIPEKIKIHYVLDRSPEILCAYGAVLHGIPNGSYFFLRPSCVRLWVINTHCSIPLFLKLFSGSWQLPSLFNIYMHGS